MCPSRSNQPLPSCINPPKGRKTWGEIYDVIKYDVISFALESEDTGRYTGEVRGITPTTLTICDKTGQFVDFPIEEVIDVDHLCYAERD